MNDSPQRSETHFVRCLKCLKVLKCSRYDTTSLLEHIRHDHPEIQIVESAPTEESPPQLSIRTEKVTTVSGNAAEGVKAPSDTDGGTSGGSRDASARPHLLPIIKICEQMEASDDTQKQQQQQQQQESEDNANVIYARRSAASSTPRAPSPRRRRLYRASIERWRPARGCIYCPRCCCNMRPLIRTRAERAATNSCGAACLLSCWPLCFLPCLLAADDKEFLHCANCSNFLGLYDRHANCVRPNREFVDPSAEGRKQKAECNAID